MAFRATNVIPADGYEDAKRLAVRMQDKCGEWIGLLAADINADQAWSWYREAYFIWSRLSEISAIANIAAYAQEQEDDPLYDVGAEFAAMMAAIQSAYQWIYNAIPRDANGYTLTHTTTTLGERVPRVFAPAATAPLIALLEAVDLAIE